MTRVLVIDDCESDLTIIKCALDAGGIEYKAIDQSSLAVETAKSYKPDIILLDLCMPVMSGHDVLEAIRTDPDTSNIEVVHITATGNVDDILTSVRLHITDCISKPVNIGMLVNKIKFLAVAKELRASTNLFKSNSLRLAEKYTA